MAQAGYLKNRRGTQSIIRLPQHGNRGDEASVSGKDYRHDGRRWVQPEDVKQYITPRRTKTRYESNDDTNSFTDDLLEKLEGVSQNPDWDDIQNKPTIPFVEFSHDNVVWFNPDRQYLFTRTYEISDFFFGDNIDADEASVFVIFIEIVIGFTAADQAIIQALDSEMRIRIQQGDSVFVEGAVEVDQKRCIFTRRRSLG